MAKLISNQVSLEVWANKLANPTQSTLPFDFVRPADARVVESTYCVEIPQDLNISFELALTAYAILVFRLTGDEDIVIGTQYGEERSPVVLRTPVDGQTKFVDFQATISDFVEYSQRNAVDFNELVDYMASKQSTPDDLVIFRTSLVYGPKQIEALVGPGKGRFTDITVLVNDTEIEFHYNSLLYKKDRLVILGEQFVQLIRSGVTAPTLPIGAISLITPAQDNLLPNPVSNLHWSEFGGAIHDIFAENATKHPERACIVETASFLDSQSKQRLFNYRQINEASNILAHHLVQSGIEIGDVVMVYAYRGVDLVIAVMGVLKAGATFSVIDPAYPPARQNIYLSVAKPRALVVLRKAGALDEEVIKYIGQELSLKTTVPALELLDDGSLAGGKQSGSDRDILESVFHLKSKTTGRIVGPDNNPTLSFTSGSEGIPKGVLGRHFSLTYYFPWMAKTFGLSENDKFTMLSGIAHDPIQRDIFTPLFLGAQLLVPTSDDIGTPGRLAEWMADHGATVTHLTPAMGQLLSAQATKEFPDLHHAFFVGDILTKRDCMRLQSLAKNVNIVNMYGTTETQRAVSFYEVASLTTDSNFLKSLKDTIPAGKGMLDVQMLIVNRNDRKQTCGVGEVGEIYVRAAGLAEGYLQLPDLTAQKFVNNWYTVEPWMDSSAKDAAWKQGKWLGPRDRLYRTGDLGRYLPDGNTECSGRADDQVKIRGFRIELGEIDTHLSRFPHVRENVTLVRRDKDEEPTLISYIVPHNRPETNDAFDAENDVAAEETNPVIRNLVRYRKLTKEIKAYLKTKLPSYAVPTVIVPLSKMPLNPNGKVDKPALPFPDTAQLEAVAQKSFNIDGKSGVPATQFSPVEEQVRDLWLRVLPTRPISVEPSDSFFDLGGHSILATKMIFEARKLFSIEIPLGLIFKEPTIAGFAAEIDSLKGSGVIDPSKSTKAENEHQINTVIDYGKDADSLVAELPQYIPRLEKVQKSGKITVFLTGATGFLGSFILRDLLQRNQVVKVIAHVRAATKEKGFERLKNSGIAFGTWEDKFDDLVEPLIGDLESKHFNLSDSEWKNLTSEVDIIIHNGALVHWVYPYSTLRGPNVVATINVMELCTEGTPKFFSFVSSTSTLDNDHYVELSDTLVERGKSGISESDDLEGSRTGLGNGYGQSKWAAEHIIRAAGSKGLRGAIIRPGYVVGDSITGASSTDDFLLRMVKGCIQLGYIPNIYNTVNMVPVDRVARIAVAGALHPPSLDLLPVINVTGQPRLRFNQFLQSLKQYGYKVDEIDYIPWRIALEKYIVEDSKDNALYPLLHFVLDNLPQSTKAPELDDTNARRSLWEDKEFTGVDLSSGLGVNVKQLGVYLAYLKAVGFLDSPTEQSELSLPALTISDRTLEKLQTAGGRTAKP